MTTGDGWARPELLCDTEWLAEHIDDDDVVLLDCDVLPSYQRLHIPGAIWSLSRYWKTDPNDDSQIYGMDDPAQFAALLGRLGDHARHAGSGLRRVGLPLRGADVVDV